MKTKKKTIEYETFPRTYFKEIEKCTPLPKSEEQKIWKKYKRTKDVMWRNKLVASNLKYVVKIASVYRNRGVPFDDLIAEGNMALIKAIEKYDIKKDVKIITYGVWWIRQAICEIIEEKNKIKKDTNYLLEDTFNDETETDNTNQVKVFNLPDEDYDSSEKIIEKQNLIRSLMSGLSKKERLIVEMYYGIGGQEISNMKEIGENFSISQERVRQILNKALKKMRSHAMIIN